ncbi:L-dopachrome tautomerase-related protein [Herbiconiux sp. SYSU D00978]|uniref:L-dopachrome tautomerase-related protein n=1 Tax=Herbiconiux sp. SYSU D00978 TaxID=2812562 RepID=UPI001A971D1E|nr:L-dopachrome tautomerase-related protein [Herbiconiux sp. SYSU D00978]
MSDFFAGAAARPLDNTDTPAGVLEVVHEFETGPMPTGVSVSRTGRVFVNFPKWGDEVVSTVVELVDGEAIPYPDEAWNSPASDDDENALVSVQSIVVDPADRLWILDTGSPLFQPTKRGGPKLVCVDLATDTVVKTIVFEPDVSLPTTYLNDIRFDLRQGTGGVGYITDSSDQGENGIIVVDLDTGEAWRKLRDHPSTKAEGHDTFLPVVEGRVFAERSEDGQVKPVAMGADGIAISADGERLYYCPLASRHYYSVATADLLDRSRDDIEVIDEGDRGGASDGMETDAAGTLYFTNYEHNSVTRRLPNGEFQTLVHDPQLLWPDTMSVAEGYLYVTANQLHRQAKYQGGEDLRAYPYLLFRTPIDSGPVRLGRG